MLILTKVALLSAEDSYCSNIQVYDGVQEDMVSLDMTLSVRSHLEIHEVQLLERMTFLQCMCA